MNNTSEEMNDHRMPYSVGDRVKCKGSTTPILSLQGQEGTVKEVHADGFCRVEFGEGLGTRVLDPNDLTPLPWPIRWHHTRANREDCAYAAMQGRTLNPGDSMGRCAKSIGPLEVDENHWDGYHIAGSDTVVTLAAAAPMMYAALVRKHRATMAELSWIKRYDKAKPEERDVIGKEFETIAVEHCLADADIAAAIKAAETVLP